jgi:hypothetical protein
MRFERVKCSRQSLDRAISSRAKLLFDLVRIAGFNIFDADRH